MEEEAVAKLLAECEERGLKARTDHRNVYIEGVPYADGNLRVCEGTLFANIRSPSHVANLMGERPHQSVPVNVFPHNPGYGDLDLGFGMNKAEPRFERDFMLSRKPHGGFRDICHKMLFYYDLLSSHAKEHGKESAGRDIIPHATAPRENRLRRLRITAFDNYGHKFGTCIHLCEDPSGYCFKAVRYGRVLGSCSVGDEKKCLDWAARMHGFNSWYVNRMEINDRKSLENFIRHHCEHIACYGKPKQGRLGVEDEPRPYHLEVVIEEPAEPAADDAVAALDRKCRGSKVGIIGLGGTGSYVLDLVAKTEVAEIRLFDRDRLEPKNRGRVPGVIHRNWFRGKNRVRKVEFYRWRYKRHNLFRGEIVAVPRMVSERTLRLLDGLDYVFVCIDSPPAKAAIFGHLQRRGIPYVDTGIGMVVNGDRLYGTARVTSSPDGGGRHLDGHVNHAEAEGDDDPYRRNVQVAEINSLCAVLAVIKWKKHLGIYDDSKKEKVSLFDINSNSLFNAECAA